MRRVRYQVAASLDGFIAGPKGEYDWIVMDPEIDFRAHFAQFDAFLIGRRTFEGMPRKKQKSKKGPQSFVFSRTLRQSDYPEVTIVNDNAAETVRALKKQAGKDIWLYGGGELFRSLLVAGVVDTVEVVVMPVLLGGGIPLFPGPYRPQRLKLVEHRLYQASGLVSLSYAVAQLASSA